MNAIDERIRSFKHGEVQTPCQLDANRGSTSNEEKNASGQHKHEAGRGFTLTTMAVREVQRRSDEPMESMNDRGRRWEL